MTVTRRWEFAGRDGAVAARSWRHPEPRYLAVLVHGYGEHLGRYEHVARALLDHGATVVGVDHAGHGLSAGERVLVADFEDRVADVHSLVEDARADHRDLPVVVIGHSMGGMIATRYAQLHGEGIAALVLSGPVLGRWEALEAMRGLDEIPDVPIDPSTLSRDPQVGRAYADDPLVWHGPFKKVTVEAWARCLDAITRHGSLGALPTLWVHGEDDRLVPYEGTAVGIEAVRGTDLTERRHAEARHEVFNETNSDEVLAEVTAFVDRVLSAPAR
ncbi:alpha/beta hydrolase [Thermomonospora umbrina]|uniref:Alpha-beta hydrolase superfamily lysophospholipase n=1 Tax=Thermomonospora umbrina TaxID=111806 RepID=A0A3D9SYN0_9ACTN|nr:alpha/beta hydrolase [Thermomonospora umbrina]REF01060.1 alpha-beta hydrolase superfamily lysophospholipase [Thermomonospora umbrina]